MTKQKLFEELDKTIKENAQIAREYPEMHDERYLAANEVLEFVFNVVSDPIAYGKYLHQFIEAFRVEAE